MGKLVGDYEWYLVCIVPTAQADSLQTGTELTVKMPFVSDDAVPVKVAAVNRDREGQAAVIFECSHMSSSLSSIRKEPIQIQKTLYEGIRCRRRRWPLAKTVKEAYMFRWATQLFSSKLKSSTAIRIISFARIEGRVRGRGEAPYLQLYDDVIVEGKGIVQWKNHFLKAWADRWRRTSAGSRRILPEPAIRRTRREEVALLAVTKTVAPELINEAIRLGVTRIGENRVQEYLGKKEALRLTGVETHLIGHLQTNKVFKIVGQVDMIQSVDSLHLARAVDQASPPASPGDRCAGGGQHRGRGGKIRRCRRSGGGAGCGTGEMKGLRVRGLMTIPPISDTEKQKRDYFCRMQKTVY